MSSISENISQQHSSVDAVSTKENENTSKEKNEGFFARIFSAALSALKSVGQMFSGLFQGLFSFVSSLGSKKVEVSTATNNDTPPNKQNSIDDKSLSTKDLSKYKLDSDERFGEINPSELTRCNSESGFVPSKIAEFKDHSKVTAGDIVLAKACKDLVKTKSKAKEIAETPQNNKIKMDILFYP